MEVREGERKKDRERIFLKTLECVSLCLEHGFPKRYFLNLFY